MADKSKRLRKILSKMRMKGMLKSVDTLEEAHLILIDDRKYSCSFNLVRKDFYLGSLEYYEHTFPAEQIHFLIATNPRDRAHIEKHFLSNAFANMKHASK